jgi:hypothetical protein
LAGIPAKQISLLREQLDRIERNLDADATQGAGLARREGSSAGRRTSLREARYKD